MKKINLTVDNMFRHPFRWGRCPTSLEKLCVFGLKITYGETMPTSFIKKWSLILYLGRTFKAWSNYPI